MDLNAYGRFRPRSEPGCRGGPACHRCLDAGAEPESRRPSADALRPTREETYEPPPEHNAHREHHESFYNAIRSGKPCFEDAEFGLRAAGPALLANVSFLEQRAVGWDAATMTAR